MRKSGLIAITTLLMATATVQAGVVYNVSAAGQFTSSVAGATTIDFESGNCGPASCSGDYLITTGSVSGKYASPYGITNRFLSVPQAKGGPVQDKVAFGLDASYDYFGLYWGSVDSYNSVLFYLDGALVDSFSGSDISPLLANGNQSSWSSNRYVNFYFTDGSLFNEVILASSNYAFESDNLAYAKINVPEPGTVALFALGLLGLLLGRKQSTNQ